MIPLHSVQEGWIAVRRGLGQGNLVEGSIGVEVGANATLDRIAALLDWPALETVLADVYAAPRGLNAYRQWLVLSRTIYGVGEPIG